MRMECAILSFTVRRIDIWKLGMENILDITLKFRKVKPSKESAVLDHLLNCNNISSFSGFTILAYRHHKHILEIKESLLIKHDRPVLNKHISSAKLFLFDNN